MKTFSKAALISASAAGFLCLGCFFASPDTGSSAYVPGATCGARAHDKKNKAEEKVEFPSAPPGELDKAKLDAAAWAMGASYSTPVLPKSGDLEDVTIFGRAEATENQMVDFILRRNPAPSLSCTVEEIVGYYYEEAGREGIRADIALCQACKETGFFKYGGDVTPDQNNYCGLGATGNHEPGARFETAQLGVRAHIQHLMVYTTTRRPETEIVDPRYELVIERRPDIHGIVKMWTGLNGKWAVPGTYYGQDILNLWRQAKVPDGSPTSLLNASEAVRRAPNDPNAYIRRAVARFYAGQTERAILDYDKAIELSPSAEAYFDRALCYEVLKDLAKAEADYTAAVALDPMMPQPWYNRGNLYLLADRWQSAIGDFERELALNPQMADARVGIGLAHAKLGDYEAAWKDFYTVTNEIHDNNEAALENQRIMMSAVKKK
ncbi:MAG: tetratricopeptide repeat protein [Schwartzia sp.]|nr:tetratricopeptide repeat protein [Schwartzia sp. (in: firmicutes)]